MAYGDLGNNFVYFDIETIPDQSPNALEWAIENVKIPANYKKQETIEEYRQSKGAEVVEKTALNGWKGHVCCIGWDKNGECKTSSVRDVKDERDAIYEFFATFDKYKPATPVGHNIISFDIPFLTARAICLGIKLPNTQAWPRNPRPWASGINDTMQMAGEMISLDLLSKATGGSGKGEYNGGAVHGLWKAGLHQEIACYCLDDVAKTKSIHERFLDIGW